MTRGLYRPRLVFLLSRRTHGALAGSFYPEAFQAPLTFAIVLLWPSRRWWFWPCLVLLLMTKEDAAVYVATFAAMAWMRSIGVGCAADPDDDGGQPCLAPLVLDPHSP